LTQGNSSNDKPQAFRNAQDANEKTQLHVAARYLAEKTAENLACGYRRGVKVVARKRNTPFSFHTQNFLLQNIK
jgi:hypothetical protein